MAKLSTGWNTSARSNTESKKEDRAGIDENCGWHNAAPSRNSVRGRQGARLSIQLSLLWGDPRRLPL
jgi:hypothetical protein